MNYTFMHPNMKSPSKKLMEKEKSCANVKHQPSTVDEKEPPGGNFVGIVARSERRFSFKAAIDTEYESV